MSTVETQELDSAILTRLLADEDFWPAEPNAVEETGLPDSFVEALILKHLLAGGTVSGRNLADRICLQFNVVEHLYSALRGRRLIVHAGSAPFNDYYYTLTETGRQQAQSHAKTCAYLGPAPVPLMDYVISVEAQAIRGETIRRDRFERAFQDISVNGD